jgi:SAM-dependent methyltransferase
VDEQYAEIYSDLYFGHWWWRSREDRVLSWIEELAGESGIEGILDVGCGDGLLMSKLEKYGSVEGVEPDPHALSESGRRSDRIHRVEFGPGFDPGHEYGLVLMLDVLEHLPDPEGALRHAFKVLKPGGHLLLTVPAFRALWTAHDDINRHRTRYRRSDLVAEVETAGFRVELVQYFFQWIAPLKLLVRLKEKVVGPSGRAQVPHPVVNQVLLALCRLEARTWGRFPWPFGSSIVLSANRDR